MLAFVPHLLRSCHYKSVSCQIFCLRLSSFHETSVSFSQEWYGQGLQEQLFQKLIEQDVKWIQKKGADELYKTLMKRTDNVQRVFTTEIPQLITMTSNLVMNIGHLVDKSRVCECSACPKCLVQQELISKTTMFCHHFS